MNVIFVHMTYEGGAPTIVGPFSNWDRAAAYALKMDEIRKQTNGRKFFYHMTQATIDTPTVIGE